MRITEIEAERVRLLALELQAVQLEGDVLAKSREDAGGRDAPLEALMLRLARARDRLMLPVE